VRRISLDALLLAALAAAGIAEALGDDTVTSPDRVTGVVATVLAVAWLAYRRRAPVAVFVAVGVLCGTLLVAWATATGKFVGTMSSPWSNGHSAGRRGRGRGCACDETAAPRDGESGRAGPAKKFATIH